MTPSLPHVHMAFAQATAAAEHFVGATAPNPPVGCVALDAAGSPLAIAAHPRAGGPHAEALAIAKCRAGGTIDRIAALVVTLEPCNHQGRTPPCAEAILAAGVPCVWVGVRDPNPRVAGGGLTALVAAGVRVHMLDQLGDARSRQLAGACRALIAPFAKAVGSGRPWVTIKQALDRDGSMIPPPGRTTFTSPAALRFAHLLRRQSDAILTGVGTVLADAPAFTVRLVADHPHKRRLLLIADRSRRTPAAYLNAAARRGFDVFQVDGIAQALDLAGSRDALRLLVEAGPRITAAVLEQALWDEHVRIRQLADTQPEQIEIVQAAHADDARRSSDPVADAHLS